MTPWLKRFKRYLFTVPSVPFKAWERAKLSVDDLDRGTVQGDKLLFVSLLKQCSGSKSLVEGKRVHSHILIAGYEHDIFVANHLIQMYGSCGCLEEARAVFDGLREKNSVSWNLIMLAHTQKGLLDEARYMFDLIPAFRRNTYSWNILVAAYSQKGHLSEARALFEQMQRRDVISWNSMISGYARTGRGGEALELFHRMDVQPDRVTYTACLDACTSLADLRQGMSIHAAVMSRGLESDLVLATALVNLYGKCGRPEEAKTAFDRIRDFDLVLHTSMLRAYGENGQLRNARRLFDRMPKRDTVCWTSMIAACGINGDLHEAKKLFDSMSVRSSVSWNAMIAAYVQNAEYEQAIDMFRLMDLEGMDICNITFVSVLDACACLPDLAKGKLVHALLLDSGLPPYSVVGTAVVNMYGKCGSLVQARRIFEAMEERSLATWNALLTSYAQKGYGDRVFELYRLMNLEGQKPDIITFIAVFSSCSHAGMVQAGWEYFTSITTDYSEEPAVDHYICMVDLLGRAGKLDEAEDLMHTMPFEPNLVAWTTMLGGCEVVGDVQRGKRISKCLDGEEAGVAPYLLLSNMYATAGYHDELVKLREFMRKKGIKHDQL